MSNQPSLLLVGNFLSSAGRNRSVSEDLALQLTKAGWSIITTSNKPGRLARLGDTVATIWNARRKYDVAHVEVYSGWAFCLAEAACWMLRRTGKPYLLTLHGGNLPNFAQHWPRRTHSLLKSAQAVTAPSRYLLETMRPYREDLRLIPNPLEIASYDFQPRLNLKPNLIWLRAFNELYNPVLAIQVLAQLVAEFPEIRLTMIGPDKGDGSWERTQQIAVELRVSDRLEMPGRIAKTEVAKHLNRGDIFINTTNVDNTPVSVLEALACGLPVVSTNVGGLPYLLQDGETGLLVPPNDATAMAAVIRRLLREPTLADHLSRTGRAEVERFDWSHVLPQWFEIFGDSPLESNSSSQPQQTRYVHQ